MGIGEAKEKKSNFKPQIVMFIWSHQSYLWEISFYIFRYTLNGHESCMACSLESCAPSYPWLFSRETLFCLRNEIDFSKTFKLHANSSCETFYCM